MTRFKHILGIYMYAVRVDSFNIFFSIPYEIGFYSSR